MSRQNPGTTQAEAIVIRAKGRRHWPHAIDVSNMLNMLEHEQYLSKKVH